MSADSARSGSSRRRPSAARGGARATLALLALVPCATIAARTDGDRRVAVSLEAGPRAALLMEMRSHVVNVQRFLDAVANGDRDAAATAARASGITSASEADEDVGRHLPAAFMVLGMRLHEGFDRLADAAARGDDPRALVGGLAAIMQQCVACHAGYRVELRVARAPRR